MNIKIGAVLQGHRFTYTVCDIVGEFVAIVYVTPDNRMVWESMRELKTLVASRRAKIVKRDQ